MTQVAPQPLEENKNQSDSLCENGRLKEEVQASRPIEDMFAVARIAQEVDKTAFSGPHAVTLMAPAKVNLYLEIGEQRPDGYHEVNTVMHALLLHDTLRMRLDPAQPKSGLSIELTMRACKGIRPLGVAPQDNIVSKAVLLLAQACGRSSDETMVVSIEKRIPAEGGLGGGSSDAAAALVGAAHLWGMDPCDDRIVEVARSLGADVAFFLKGGCALLSGVGDVLERELSPMGGYVVLVKPDQGVSTAAAYKAFDMHPVRIAEEDKERALNALEASKVPLCNNMESASEQVLPSLRDVRLWALNNEEVTQALVSGSGSTVFALCPSLDAASRVVCQAQKQGWWARLTMLSKGSASIVPSR